MARIGVVLFDEVEELDAVGPWEVLAAWTRTWPDDGWEVVTVSVDRREVRAAKGMTFIADHLPEDVGPLDVVVHPGGQGTRRLFRDPEHLARVQGWAASASLMLSVCTGSLVYAAAGLLRGRPATTHWGALELLAEVDPSIEVRSEDRFVDDGEVITSAGVSAGIDAALHLVARLRSPERAAEVAHYIQYEPRSPL